MFTRNNDKKMLTQNESTYVSSRFAEAIQQPISKRCTDLTVLLDGCSKTELRNLFPILIESIYGTSIGISWNLRDISKASSLYDYDCVRSFLGPQGPVFRWIYKLIMEANEKYDYSIFYLPVQLRTLCQYGQPPPFYSKLLINEPPRHIFLQLNPFDFYMFSFTYYLINPKIQRLYSNWSSTVWNTVYFELFYDYLVHFLPIQPSQSVLPEIFNYYATPKKSPNNSNRSPNSSLLFRNYSQGSNNNQQVNPLGIIWRSETVLQVYVDFWITYNNEDCVFYDANLKVTDLPASDYIRIVRVLVKHLHSFASTHRLDRSALCEFRYDVQQMLQGPMYTFLRYLVARWPLDASFRLILELWLSYLQPWRYLHDYHHKLQDNTDSDESMLANVKIVDQQYMHFIADNLLLYTGIFQQIMPRFSRVDLIGPKNALMLYRILKVFAQPHLIQLIREIEYCFISDVPSPSHSYSTFISDFPGVSCNTIFSDSREMEYIKWGAVVRQRIYENEGPEYCYKPLFIAKPDIEILNLIEHMKHCQKLAYISVLQQIEDAEKHKRKSFLSCLFWGGYNSCDEFTLEQRKKVPMHLYLARKYLIEIFQIETAFLEPPPTSFDDPNLLHDTSEMFQNNSIDFSLSLSRAKLRSVKYDGDPDLCPIQSHENGYLVRTLYQISQFINEYCSQEIEMNYYRNDFVGHIFKQILQPPMVAHKFERTRCGYSERVEVPLPARLSLRKFASQRWLMAFLFGLFLAWYKNFGIFSYIFIIIILLVTLIMMKAAWSFHVK